MHSKRQSNVRVRVPFLPTTIPKSLAKGRKKRRRMTLPPWIYAHLCAVFRFCVFFVCILYVLSIILLVVAQHRHHLSDKQLEAMLELLKGNFGDRVKSGVQLPANIRQADSSMREKAGASMVRYDGCIKCNQHVWGPADKSKVCPLCGGNRYDERGHAREQVIHFPLKPR